jgi:hypothetical protein
LQPITLDFADRDCGADLVDIMPQNWGPQARKC